MELPVAWANYLSMLGFLLLGVLVWLIPRNLILQGSPADTPWRDIRWWATLLIIIQLGLYALFT